MARVRTFDLTFFSVDDQLIVFDAITTLLNNPKFLKQYYQDGTVQLMQVRRHLKRSIVIKLTMDYPNVDIRLMNLKLDRSIPKPRLRCKCTICSTQLTEELFEAMKLPTSSPRKESFFTRFTKGRVAGIIHVCSVLFFSWVSVHLYFRWFVNDNPK